MGDQRKVIYLNYPRFTNLNEPSNPRFDFVTRLREATPEIDMRDAGDILDRLRMIQDEYGLAQLRRAVEITGKKDDCKIRVSDQGPGIAPEERDAVFDAFHRGVNAGSTSGTGLGLAVAKTAVERLGGQIRIVGEPGKGTTFELILPGLLKARSPKSTRKEP